MKYSQITEKGQILIPVQIRKKFGLKAGSKVVVTDDSQTIRITPLTAESIRNLAGILKGSGVSKDLLSSRHKDKVKNK